MSNKKYTNTYQYRAKNTDVRWKCVCVFFLIRFFFEIASQLCEIIEVF